MNGGSMADAGDTHVTNKASLQAVAESRGVQVRYYVITKSEASAKKMGYFAEAWQCRAVVGGRPYNGSFRKSRRHAEEDAAKVALAGMEGGSGGSGDG